jgi:hypothetical protein
MSIPAGSQLGFRFIAQEEFDRMLRERTLVPGFWYFMINSNVFHIAFTRDTYQTYSGVDVRELVEELLKQVELDENYLYQMITEQVLVSPNFILSLAQYFITESPVIQQIANIILQDESVMHAITQQLQEIIHNIETSIVSINAPDGSVLAQNNHGVLMLPAASNTQFGVVKGQSNSTPTTWHNVSTTGGLLSINREQLEAFIESKIKAAGMTHPGGSGGVCTPRKNFPCHPQKMSWRTMDGMLEAQTKHDVHLFAPFVFPKTMPKRREFFDKVTFIPIPPSAEITTND